MNPFVGYRITSPYGGRIDPLGQRGTEFHRGIDLVKAHKSPINPFVDGVVIHAKLGLVGSGFGNYGNVAAIKSSDGALHCYCHLDSVNVRVGQVVTIKDVIGYQGNSGRSTGSHLHYEIRKLSSHSYGYGTDVDPTEYLIEYYKGNELKMDVKDGTKIIKVLSDAYGATSDIKVKAEMHRLADVVREISGIK